MPFFSFHLSRSSSRNFYCPIEERVKIVDSQVSMEVVDPFAPLPPVELFDPSVQIKAGVPAKQISTIIKKPSLSDVTAFADKVEREIGSKSVEPVESVEPAEPVESTNI